MSNDVQVERARAATPPVILTIPAKTALRLSALLVSAVLFEDNEDFQEIHEGIEAAVNESGPSFSYNEDSGVFESDDTGDLD